MRQKRLMRWFSMLILMFASVAIAESLPVLSPDASDGSQGEVVGPGDAQADGAAPKKEAPKAAAGATIMTAEQGEELGKKIDKLLEDQKVIIEKLDQLQKDLDFVKTSVRTR